MDRTCMGTTNITLVDLSSIIENNGFANDIDGQTAIDLTGVNTLEDAGPGDISFLANHRYAHLLSETKASVVIVGRDDRKPKELTVLRCDNPYAAVTVAIIRIHGHREHPAWGIDRHAIIADGVRIGEGADIGPYVTVRDGVVIGKNVTIYPGCYIGDGAVVGNDVTLFPNVVLYDGVRLGDRVTIHAGTVVGEDGLGYAPVDGRWLKIPQVGSVLIEDDVEIGAVCAIDRATLGTTRIGRGSKLSNLIVVGHGARIGEDCMIVAQAGFAGSCIIGNHVSVAGQVGVGGHLTVGDNARLGAQSGVHWNIEPNVECLGTPAVKSMDFHRQTSLIHRLPEMKKRVQALEKEVERLRKRMEDDD